MTFLGPSRCHLDPTCVHGPHQASDHPCGRGTEAPGTPCRFCGDPVPLDGRPCPKCWISLDGMALADIRALFAADGTFETTVVLRDRS